MDKKDYFERVVIDGVEYIRADATEDEGEFLEWVDEFLEEFNNDPHNFTDISHGMVLDGPRRKVILQFKSRLLETYHLIRKEK